MPGHYYELLGVPQDASVEEIRSAYRQRALVLHPDRNPGDEQAAQLFSEISQAYEALVDPARRAAYDAACRQPRPWWADLMDAAAETLTVLDGVRAAFEAPALHKRSSCPACQGAGEIVFELGPLRMARSCSSCEEEKPSTASRDRA